MERKLPIAVVLAGAAAAFYAYRRVKSEQTLNNTPVPPGPKRYPIIGSLLSFPQGRWYETFTQWQKKYGDIIYMNILGTPMLVVNSLDTARDLMEKRGHIYSGRPKDVMNYYVMGWEWNFIMADPGQVHSDCRTIFKKSIGQSEVESYAALIDDETERFVKELAKVSGDPWEIVQSGVGAIVIKATYGDSIYQAHGKELAELNNETLDLVTWVTTQFWLVNFIPSLRFLPSWFPMPFKGIGKKGFVLQERIHNWPWDETIKYYQSGIASPSIAMEYIETNESLTIAKDAIGIMYGAGVDNTSSTILTFITTLLQNPAVQRKVHEELDQEIPAGTSPTFNDRPHLKYLDAAWRESMRMNPSTPLGLPHLSLQEDIYEGMYIPRGSLVTANIGFICRDPRIWNEPNTYRPERWLEPSSTFLPDVYDLVFGFGRRICPGQFLADRIGFTFMAALLKTYDILPLEGECIPTEYTYQDAVTRRPEGVRCRFRSRIQAH